MNDASIIGILGGTGAQGRGLGYRFARAGRRVLLGSRDAGRAEAAAREVGFGVLGAANADVAGRADVVVVAVPYDGHRELLESMRQPLAGKVVVDCVNAIGRVDGGLHALPVPEGSAAEQAAAVLPDSRVVAAFHHVSAVLLLDRDREAIDCDCLVLGDDGDAVDVVIDLAAAIPGVRGYYAGTLRDAGQVEALTANLLAVNKRYRAHAGLRLTDV